MFSVPKTMQPLLINLAPVLFIALLAYRGWRRGLVAVATTLIALILGVVLAAVAYMPVGGVVARLSHLPLAVSAIVAYLGLVISGQLIGLIGFRLIATRIPRRWHASRANGVGGAVMAGAQGILAMAIIYGLLGSLPIGTAAQASLSTGVISGPLARLGRSFQSLSGATPVASVNQAVSLLAVDPESTQSTPLGFTTADVSVDEASEVRMLELVNHERNRVGLSSLNLNTRARAVARDHSRDMLARGYFSHVDQVGHNPFDRMRAGGVRFAAAGENIALAPTLIRAHSGLMNSPPHRENILNPAYKSVGIGIIDAGQYGIMVTQDFTD